MNIEQIQLIHETARDGSLIDAANLAFIAEDINASVSTREEAIAALRTLEMNLAEQKRWHEVAVLLLGHSLFDSRPQFVKDVFEEVVKNHKLIILGSSSSSKTYSCGALFYFHWRADPYWTQVILAGPSEHHLYGNLFSHIVRMHKASVIPMTPDEKAVDINETDMFISMHDALPEMRIRCVLCKYNQTSATGLRGHKPKPRAKPHPVYGRMSRVMELIDEGTHVSPGAFEDIKTTEACINPETDSVKIVIACNPEGVGYKIVELAEPSGGWDAEQVDTLHRWVSEKGYPVLRLDGKRCENVVERRVIYEGLITYESFMDFLRSGEYSGPYWAKGRGFPPLRDNAWTIIPPAWVQSQRGEPMYVGNVTNIAALDTALGGGDKSLWGIGRWGEAAGWTRANGEFEWFVNRTNPDERRTKHVMVLDQIFTLPKSDNTVTMIQEVIGRSKDIKIGPYETAMDRGGNASGVWSHAKKYWGDVLGVDSGERASDSKVLADDLMVAYDVYQLMASELWFATKRWLDPTVGAVLINPAVPPHPIFNQLTTRRYRNIKGGKVQVEPKHEWRARNGGISPDEADVLNLMVAWCRQRGGVTPGMLESKTDTHTTGEIVSLETADEHDSLGTSPEWEPSRLDA